MPAEEAATPRARLPGHHGHEEAGVPLAQACSKRLGVPRALRDAARLTARWHTHVHRLYELRPATVLALFEGIDAFRRPERLETLLRVCEADVRGRLGFERRAYGQADRARAAFAAVRAITAKERGLQRDDLVSIQGEFSKGDVLHVYDEQGNEFARGLTNFSSEETILMARNPEMEIEDVIGYKTKSAVVGAENILILEDHHLQLDAPEEDVALIRRGKM